MRQKQIEASKAVQQYREKSMINDVPAGGTSSPLSSLEIINLSRRSWLAPYAIRQSRSISPNRKPPSRDRPSVG